MTIFYCIAHNVWHMSSGGFRNESLATEAETKIEVLHLATHEPRHYLYAVLCTGGINSLQHAIPFFQTEILHKDQ
jgi:hypothetical protein